MFIIDPKALVKEALNYASNNIKKKKTYKTLNEVLEEIRAITNRHKSKKDQDLEELERMMKQISDSAMGLKLRLDSQAKVRQIPLNK